MRQGKSINCPCKKKGEGLGNDSEGNAWLYFQKALWHGKIGHQEAKMSEINLFLVPRDEPRSTKRGSRQRVLDYLEEKQIINGYYNKELAWFAAGKQSTSLFTAQEFSGPAFLYAIIYDQDAAHFVPDAHTAGFGAICRFCMADLDENLYAMLEDQGEAENAKDMKEAAVTCSTCGQPNPLRSLKAMIETAVTNFYMNFCNVNSIEFAKEIKQDLEEIVGVPLRVILERM